MIPVILWVFVVNLVQPQSLNIDLSSIHVIPELYQLCWKQNVPKEVDYLIGENWKSKELVFQVISDKSRTDYYCISKKDIHSTYKIRFPLKINDIKKDVSVTLKFFLPLAPPLKFIRRKIVSTGVYFELHHDFAGLLSEKLPVSCDVLVTYYWKNSMNIMQFKMELLHSRFLPMDSGSTFTAYYSCVITGILLSSSFITYKGLVYKEETEPLEPFIQFPFCRFLVSQWKQLKSYNKSYYILISEVPETEEETCLKMFRLCSASELRDGTFWKIDVPSRCNKDIVLEDLGSYIIESNIRVVLDMVNPLKPITKHKFTLFYQNITTNKVEENFIYFETLINDNSGYIKDDIYKYMSSFKNNFIRNITPTMNQRILSDFPYNPVNAKSLQISNFFEKEIIQSVSASQIFRSNATGPFDYQRILGECGSSCREGTYPYFYIILKKEKNNDKVEIIALPKITIARMGNPQMTSYSMTNTFTISWNITNYPQGVTPMFFAIIMKRQDSPLICSSLHIIVCKTCNQVAEFDLQKRISNLTRWCKVTNLWKNHYEANAKLMTFTTPKMIPKVNFLAEVIPFHLHSQGDAASSPEVSIKAPVWRKWLYIPIITVASVVGLIILVCVGVSIKFLGYPSAKEDEAKSDSNKYDEEEEISCSGGDDNKYYDEPV